MMRRALWLLILITLVLIGCRQSDSPDDIGPVFDVADTLGGQAQEGYARAEAVREFHFPADHGPHPDFQTEWWYFTGNLNDKEGARYGFQLTFFRIALSPQTVERESDWATRQAYMAHFAITDASGEKFYGFERFSRGAAGLAGAELDPFRVWLEDWSISNANGNEFPWELKASTGSIGFSLSIEPLKDIVLQGDRGLSQKSGAVGNASYYYSITRLAAEGTITIDGEVHYVKGTAWLDREWSTSALGEGQIGWDWFALQLDDGRDIMYYQLRQEDGQADPSSQGIIVSPQGNKTGLNASDVKLEVLNTWESPGGGLYPLEWRMTLIPSDETLIIRTILEGQEQNLSVRYWEGAIDVFDETGEEEIGRGYMELTSYDE